MVFGTALSGLLSATKDLEVIGNNIANSGTIGFKRSRAQFADVYAAGGFGSGTNAVGSGSRLSRVQQNFAQGNLSFTNEALDMAISGAGFFVLSDSGARLYSRAGAFSLSNDGYIENSTKQRLQGAIADDLGNITTNVGDIQISRANILPRATTSVDMGVNLFGGEQAKKFNWVGGLSPAENTFNNVSTATIFDSLGNTHTLGVYFIKADETANVGDPNASSPISTQQQWYVAFQIDGQQVPANVGPNNTDNLIRMNFNQDGTFANVQDVTNTNLPSAVIPLSFTLGNGANTLNFSVDLSESSQFGSPFAIQSVNQDGYTTGQLDGVDIDNFGVIFGRYTNGKNRAMGQIELANFSNPDGLQSLGDNLWVETASSGQAVVSKAGTAGLGLIQSGALEDSNVEITADLVKLISAQRNFQANAQTIKTGDAITQTIINIR